MFSAQMTIAGFDPELAQGDGRRAQPPGGSYRADRLGELCQPAGARGAGLGADQQVRRRLSRQALLRRLRIRRYRRAAGDRARQAAVRRRLRQRAAAFGLAGERRGVFGAAQSRRHDSRHEPRSWRSLDARREGQFFGQAVQGGAVRDQGRHRRDRLRPGGAPGAGAPPEDDRRGLFRVFARHRLGAVSRHRRFGRRVFLRRHGACRGPRRRGPVSEPGAVRRCRDHDHAQDAARPARRADSGAAARRSCTRSSIPWCFPALRAVR